MIGSRAASGSVATRLRKVVIACFGVEQVGVHVHVEQVGAATHLLQRDVDRALEVAGLDQPAELRRASDVRPLTHHDEPRVRAYDERLETREARQLRRLGNPARRETLDRSCDLPGVLGGRPAAAADEVHEAVLGECTQEPARIAGLLVVEPERVREARVRMARDVGRRDVGEALEERTHLRCAEGAVDSDDQGLGVLDRDPEGVRGLAGQVPAAPVDSGEREPERKLRRDVACGDDRGLGVQGVEDGLHHEQIDASVAQSGDLLLVRLAHLIEGDRPVRGILDPGRQRKGDVQRAERAGHEPRLLGSPPRPRVGGLPREPGAFEAHLGGKLLQVVVSLPDAGRREGVRGRDVGARVEVGVVELGDDLRVREVQEVGVALDVLRVLAESLAAVLRFREPASVDEDAPRTVEHEDALGEKLLHLYANVCHIASGPKGAGSRSRRSGSLGVFYPGRQAAFKAVQVFSQASGRAGSRKPRDAPAG